MGGAQRHSNRPCWRSEGGARQNATTILCWIGEDRRKRIRARVSEGDDCCHWSICEVQKGGFSSLKDKDFEMSSRESAKQESHRPTEEWNGEKTNKVRSTDWRRRNSLENSCWQGKSYQLELYPVFPHQSAFWDKRSPKTPPDQNWRYQKTIHDPVTGEITTIEWIEGPTKMRLGSLNKRPRMVTQCCIALEVHGAQ